MDKAVLFQQPSPIKIGVGWIVLNVEGKNYFLLGQEDWQDVPCVSTVYMSWCPCGGKFEPEKHKHIGQTILDEVYEETVGLYKFTEDDLKKNETKCYTYSSTARLNVKKTVAIFRIDQQQYVEASRMVKLCRDKSLPSEMRERSNFVWALIDSNVLKQLSDISPYATSFQPMEIDTVDIEGREVRLKLRNSFIEDLIQPGILE